MLAVKVRRLTNKDGPVARPLERRVIVERRTVQDAAVVPNAQVAFAPRVADLGVVRLRLEAEEVVEQRARLVDREAFDALGEGLVDVQRVEPRDGVGADDRICGRKCQSLSIEL